MKSPYRKILSLKYYLLRYGLIATCDYLRRRRGTRGDFARDIRDIFKQGGTISADTLKYNFKNGKQFELVQLICDLANKRVSGTVPSIVDIQETIAYLQKNMSEMDTDSLDHAEMVALSGGLFVLAYQIRKANEELVILKTANRNKLKTPYATKLFWSCLNSENPIAADKLYERLTLPGRVFYGKTALKLCNAMGLSANETFVDSHRAKNNDPVFAQMIKGKRLAIIGPSNSMLDQESILSEYDLIIRMNYRGKEFLSKNQNKLLPNISYYSSLGLSKLDKDKFDTKEITNLDFAVFRQIRYTYQREMLNAQKARCFVETPLFFFSGSGNLLQCIIMDLSLFEPDNITIFCADLYLAKDRYHKGYKIPGTDQDTLDFWRSFSAHNIISQYEYVMHLYKRNLIDADETLSEVLSLGTERYLFEMEQIENQREI
jgi:hypothetical protein